MTLPNSTSATTTISGDWSSSTSSTPTSSLAGYSYQPVDPSIASNFAYSTAEPAIERQWVKMAADIAIVYAGTSAKYSSSILIDTFNTYLSHQPVVKNLVNDIDYLYGKHLSLSATEIAENLPNDFWTYVEAVKALALVEAGETSTPFLPFNISVHDTTMRPSGMIYGYKTVAALYDFTVSSGLGNYTASSGSDIIYLEDTPTVPVDAGAGNDIVIFSSQYYTGDEVIVDGAGSDRYIFGGYDDRTSDPLGWLIYNVNSSDYMVQKISGGSYFPEVKIIHSDTLSGEVDLAVGVDRIVFNDRTLAFDVEGNAGQAYRLYQAAFARTPDIGGLSYWVDVLDSGAEDLATVAGEFLRSNEFQQLYGTNVSNGTFLTHLYQNILHRAPDAGGFNYWKGLLDTGYARDLTLAAFSESAENKANVQTAIDGGIWLL